MNKGKIIRRTGEVFGTALELNLIVAGSIIGGIVLLTGRKKLGKKIKKNCRNIGRYAGRATKISTKLIGTIIEAASSEGITLARNIGKQAVKKKVKIYGDASAFYDKDKIVEAGFEEL